MLLGAVAGVEAAAVIRGEVAGPHEVPASPQPPQLRNAQRWNRWILNLPDLTSKRNG